MRQLRLLLGHDASVAYWVGMKSGAAISPPFTTIGFIDEDGALRTGFVFFRYEAGGNIDFTLATTTHFTRGMLTACATYVFSQLECKRLTSRPRTRDTSHISMLKRVGFVQEAILKDYYHDDDALQMRLLKRDAKRWMI